MQAFSFEGSDISSTMLRLARRWAFRAQRGQLIGQKKRWERQTFGVFENNIDFNMILQIHQFYKPRVCPTYLGFLIEP